jgi:ubiquinone biosynthesis protein COQ4
MDELFTPPHFDVLTAGRSVAALLQDPDDLPRVFTLIEAMSGTAPNRLLWGFRRTETGKRILRERRDISRILSDRAALRAMPEGSLGRAYLAFVESEGISAQGIRDASVTDGKRRRPETIEYLHQRMRDTHDLWHAAVGYKGDVLGELSLLAFGLAQHWNTAIAMLVLAGIAKGLSHGGAEVILDGYRRGRAARWMPSYDWEAMLERPLSEVRAQLSLGAPPDYVPVRSDQLRAEGIVGTA